MSDFDARFEAAVKKRDKLAKDVTRLQGRMEEAQRNLQSVEDECRAKKFEPDQIDTVIEQLEKRYEAQIEELERANEEIEQKLKPYL